MTKVDLVTGFLGAGKTSFIKLYVRWLEKIGARYAIIENEFGMSGIDSSILRNSCGDVTELSGGCICCGLKVNFYSLLQELAGNGSYDRIIVEPSGIFNLDDFLDVINSLSEKNILELGTIITVAEPEYIFSKDSLIRELLLAQMHSTATIILSKLDTKDDSYIESCVQQIDGIFNEYGLKRDSGQEIIAVPWDNLSDKLLEKIHNGVPVLISHVRKNYDHSSLFRSAAFDAAGPYSAGELADLLKAAFHSKYGQILRIKGYANSVTGKILEINCTRDSVSIKEVDKSPAVCLNFIGESINRRELKELLKI